MANVDALPGEEVEDHYLDFLDQLDQSYRRGFTRAVLVVIVGLVLTAVIVVFAVVNQRSVRDDTFDDAARNSTQVIENRVNSYTDPLWGIRSFVDASPAVTRSEFTNYVDQAGIEQRFPGTQALGMAERVNSAEIPLLEQEVRAEGFSSYAVHPDSGNSEALPVVFLDPVEGNEAAFGFDIVGDNDGEAAVEIARNTGTPTAGAPLALGEQERALVVFLAMYASGGVPAEDQRAAQFDRAALGLYLLDDLLADVLGPEPEVAFEIYDSGPITAPGVLGPGNDNLLYNSDDDVDGVGGGGLKRQQLVELLNRQWTIVYTPGPGFSSGSSLLPWILGVGGIAVTLLVAALVLELARSRRRATNLAEDMTESLVRRERELQQANENMVRSNRDLERYATIAAHDLQEPLRSILAYADLIERKHGDDVPEEVSDFIARMSQAAKRMRTLITDLLAYARLEQKESRDEVVNLEQAAHAARGDLNYLIEETGATVEIDQLPTVTGNSRELIGVIANLLSNAIKYRSPDRPPHVRISAKRGDGEWVIGISDNGIGIAEDYHLRIFELFRRLGPRDESSGTGLGLAICARTIAQHGGRIWVESEEGSGSTFWFTLPIREAVRPRAGVALN